MSLMRSPSHRVALHHVQLPPYHERHLGIKYLYENKDGRGSKLRLSMLYLLLCILVDAQDRPSPRLMLLRILQGPRHRFQAQILPFVDNRPYLTIIHHLHEAVPYILRTLRIPPAIFTESLYPISVRKHERKRRTTKDLHNQPQ
jgi:hypothetical protein